jgi:nitroreductase
MRDLYASNASLIEVTARRNSSLQGAYLVIAARALGLDCWPMSGFDNAKLDEEFFGAGIFPRRSREVQFPVQSRLWRSVKALFAQSASRIQRGVHIDVGVGHGFVESVKADNVLPAGTTSKPSPAASAEITLPFPALMVLPTFTVQSCAPVAVSSA